METAALLNLWKKKAEYLKNGFTSYKKGLITHGELDYLVMQNGCLSVDEEHIPWNNVLHLVITNPISRLQQSVYSAPVFPEAHWAFFDQEQSLLYVAWPSPDKIPQIIKRCSQTLNSLRLYSLTMQELPSLSSLTQLSSLDISRCYELTKLRGLSCLKQLTYLNLTRCQSLTELKGLSNLKKLRYLNLSGCNRLTQLHGLEQLTQLVTLKLSYCQSLTTLPDGVRCMKALRMLDLMSMNLKSLPDWLPEIAEAFTLKYNWSDGEKKAVVSLKDTTVEGVDMSIFEQPYEMVVKWFEDRNKVPLNEIKVVFLGDGEAGKSHTIARLMNGGGDPDLTIFDGQSTPGIVISDREYDLNGRKIQVHYWDFGGQEIMHSMHRIFLTGRTMYVILLNARGDTQGDRARYWLHNVKSFAPDAPVLLVLNKVDQNENASVDEVDLRGRYGKLTQIVRLSALKFSREEFNDRFTRVLLNEIEKTGFLDVQWPTAWTKVKEQLENMEKHYIMGSDYQAICADCQVDQNQKDLLHWFNDLGISFCCDGEDDYTLEDYVILKPDWITNALYIILFNKLEGVKNGLIPHKSIYNVLKTAHKNSNIRCTLPEATYTSNDIGYVLGIMRKFNLSFPQGTDHEFLPMLCQQNSTVDVQYYHKDADTLEFNMEFDYLPNNLLHRLMVERSGELDMDNVWRTGARFCLPELGLSAVVVIDGNTLRFFIRHTDSMHRPNTYLAMLKANVDRIWQKMNLKAPANYLVYKVGDKRARFSYDRLLKMYARGHKEEFCEELDQDFIIEDILNQSAPAGSRDENFLKNCILDACLHLQDNKNYRGWDENGRNSVVRDSLTDKGYTVHDQTLRGQSASGKSYGELDLLIQLSPNRPFAICEALIVEGYSQKWNEHLDKLLNEYNPTRLPALFLLTYVDCPAEKFNGICGKYLDRIRNDKPKNFQIRSAAVDWDTSHQFGAIKIAHCKYSSGGYEPNVYPIFLQMDPK